MTSTEVSRTGSPSDSDGDPVLEASVDVTLDDDLEVPHHMVDLADMADELAVDPSLDAEDYVRQFSPENLGLDNQDDPDLNIAIPEDDQDDQSDEVVIPDDD